MCFVRRLWGPLHSGSGLQCRFECARGMAMQLKLVLGLTLTYTSWSYQCCFSMLPIVLSCFAETNTKCIHSHLPHKILATHVTSNKQITNV